MDALPTPRQSECLLLEISRATDGRLEGQVRTDNTDCWRPFSGVLELLKALEETLDASDSAAHAEAEEGTES
jgi:hypothetical protein